MEREWEHVGFGAFIVCYGNDVEDGQTRMLIMKRGACFKEKGKDGYGVPGGHIDLDKGYEQPADAAARELGEEVIDDQGQAVLGVVAPERLQLIDCGVDYLVGRPGTLHAGCGWAGFRCELTNDEIAKLKAYEKRMHGDAAYLERVREASNQELGNIHLVTPAEVVKNIETGIYDFSYAHEQKWALQVAKDLLAVKVKLHATG